MAGTRGRNGDLGHYARKTPALLFASDGDCVYNNKISEREIKEATLFTITSKSIKYLGINLPKESKDLYSENYKTLMKEIEDDTNRWKDILCSWIGRINIV